MRYRLRTLLILLAILPPLLWVGWGKYEAWRAEQERRKAAAQLLIMPIIDEQGEPSPRQELVPDDPRESSDLEHGSKLE